MNRRILLATLVLALFLVATVVLAYVNQFGVAPSTSHDIWGQFGDFFAGLLNPIFSLLAFVALMHSLVLQNEEAKKAQTRFDDQYAIAKQEFDGSIKEKLASELLTVVRDIDARLDGVRQASVSLTGAQDKITIAQIVAEGNRFRSALAQSDSYTRFMSLANESGTINEAIVRDLANLVSQMKDVLAQFSDFRRTSQAPLIVYYANKTYPLITVLEDVGVTDYTTREFFATVSDRHH